MFLRSPFCCTCLKPHAEARFRSTKYVGSCTTFQVSWKKKSAFLNVRSDTSLVLSEAHPVSIYSWFQMRPLSLKALWKLSNSHVICRMTRIRHTLTSRKLRCGDFQVSIDLQER